MNNNMLHAIRTVLAIFAFSLLSGCGGSGSGGGTSIGGANYGTLALSGPGATITGTSFNAVFKAAIGSAGVGVTTEWYDNNPPGATYPYLVLNIFQDSTGAVTMVEVVKMLDANNNAAGQWVAQPPTAGAFSVTTTAITFNNLSLPGRGATPVTTSLTLNGTLNF